MHVGSQIHYTPENLQFMRQIGVEYVDTGRDDDFGLKANGYWDAERLTDFRKQVESFRDWGRDCWCDHKSHRDGECRQRFDWENPGLGEPYDHRYYFTEIGYNLKMTDIQAAIGLPQLDKLPDFVAARKHNFTVLYEGLTRYADYLVLPVWSPKADPAWFAFTIAVRENAPFTRRDLNDYLRERKVETRYLFAGNILHQPGYRDIPHRVAPPMPETERVLKSAFFIGVYPGMDDARLAYILQIFEDFFTAWGL